MSGGERSWTSWVTRQWPLKLLALVLAFGAWLVVTTDSRVIQDVTAFVEVKLPDDDTVLVGDKTKQVTLRLRGSAAQFRRLETPSIRIQRALSEGPSGERTFRIRPDDVRGVPPNVEIVMIDPQVVTFEVAPREIAELPVEVRFSGSPAEGFAVYDHDVTPDRVRIAGPDVQIAEFDSVQTDPVRIQDVTEPFSTRVRLNPGSADMELLDEQEVTVRVRVDAEPTRRTFSGIPVEPIGIEAGRVEFGPTSFDVELSGPPRVLERLGPASIRLVADVSGIEPGTGRKPVPVRLEWVGVPSRDRVWITDVDDGARTVRARVARSEDGR